ncbi:hypothetical protein HRI_000870200 [Hibiscus trionum]|uniref:Uncharacterized protein n=1 Tax=Hibiscus trionum TaxID=183268 RepID=A0A9W7H6P0_HIBTR|nr:hypothetical protein HRI_000870200 [Hibiscus trionum]
MNFFMVREGGSHQAIQKELDIQGKAYDSFYREGPSPNAELKGCTSNSFYCHLAWLNRCLILSTHAKPPTIDRSKSCSDEIRSSQGAMGKCVSLHQIHPLKFKMNP